MSLPLITTRYCLFISKIGKKGWGWSSVDGMSAGVAGMRAGWGCWHASACRVFYDARDATQLVMYLSSMTKPWVQPLAQCKPNVMVHTRNPSIQEAEAKGSRYQA